MTGPERRRSGGVGVWEEWSEPEDRDAEALGLGLGLNPLVEHGAGTGD